MAIMAPLALHELQTRLNTLAPSGPEYTSQLIDLILQDAARRGASDVHFDPTHRAVQVHYRLDGVLQRVATLSRDVAPNVTARLKVLAELLTYRLDIPQEGSIRDSPGRYGVDMRVSTFPTIQGERAVVRLFDPSNRTLELDELGLAPDVLSQLKEIMRGKDGVILLTGPSGSGKTTTIYACLRHLHRASKGGKHIITLEDPVEQVIEGISQAQARPGTEFDFARGLRSLLRQDPEVIMIGEVRDPETSEAAIQAGLTGHLVFTTLHAGSACGVIGRLLDMGVEPYLLTSGLRGILNQRLVRRLCPACGGSAGAPGTGRQAGLCDGCGGSGYRGRLLLTELLTLDDFLCKAILERSDTATLEALARRNGRLTLRHAAQHAVADGLTTLEEIDRVLGPEVS
jgi:type II secretory ATPase GspE/PulE/Tfp pilus assembly ATPase PilB-like protein